MIIRLKLTAGNVNLGDVDVTFPGKEVSSSDPARRADTTMTLDVLALDDGALLEIAETAACDLRDKMQYSRGEYEGEDPDEEGERDMEDKELLAGMIKRAVRAELAIFQAELTEVLDSWAERMEEELERYKEEIL